MSRRARVLAIHRYFWPDTPPYAAMLRTIAAHWAERGVDVEVLSSQPSYKPGTDLHTVAACESLDGFEVRRVPMRTDVGPRGRKLRNMVRFSLASGWHVLMGPRRDVVMCSTAPQVLLGWAVSWAARARGARFVYHCMDLHPEIGRLSGEFANPWVYRVLMRMDTATCRRAAAVVVLSDDMRDALVARDPRLAERVHVLNNFDLPGYDDGAGETYADEDRLVVAFAGNIGRFQGLEAVTEAVLGEDSRLDGVRLVLMGEGAAKVGLQTMVAEAPPAARDRVRFLPHGSVSAARALMRSSDLGLVTLSPGVIRYAYPSKTATYLSEGLPVLAGVEPDSALARAVREGGYGDVLPPGVDGIRDTLLRWSEHREELDRVRRSARAAWAREFSVEPRLQDWDRLLDELVPGGLR